MVQAHAGNGIVVGHMDDLSLEQTQKLLQILRDEATSSQGNLVILRCPSEWKKTLAVWGSPRGDGQMMRTVREKLDPRQLFNPGRVL